MNGSGPTPTRYLVEGRATGKTTSLVRWLLGGHPVDSWPGWTRLMLVSTHQNVEYVARHHRDVDGELRMRGCHGGLGKVLLGPTDIDGPGALLGRGRRLGHVELAVDDADLSHLRYLRSALPVHVALVAINGVRTTLRELAAEHEASEAAYARDGAAPLQVPAYRPPLPPVEQMAAAFGPEQRLSNRGPVGVHADLTTALFVETWWKSRAGTPCPICTHERGEHVMSYQGQRNPERGACGKGMRDDEKACGCLGPRDDVEI